jgi:prepilin peptidase CpaA
METIPLSAQAVLAAVVLLSAAFDLWKREIPNWLTLGAILAGLLLNPWRTSLGGLGLAALIFLPIFYMRWLGGGDVKLMGAVGTLAGPANLLVIFILDSILGGVVALAALVFRGRLRRTLGNVFRIFRPAREAELEAGNEKSMGMPRAVTIAAATLLILWVSRLPEPSKQSPTPRPGTPAVSPLQNPQPSLRGF